MSDQIAASISIGGAIPAGLIPELLNVINVEGLAYAWGESRSDPWTAEQLLEQSALPEHDGVLWLCDDQARSGMFDILEEWLTQNGIPFDRQSDSKYEYDGGIQYFRPGIGKVWRNTTKEWNPLISYAKARETLGLLRAGKIEGGIKTLEDELGPDIPDLPPFQIVRQTEGEQSVNLENKFCDIEFCENPAFKSVPVSENSYGDSTRNLCAPCNEAYTIGVQHGDSRLRSAATGALFVLDKNIDGAGPLPQKAIQQLRDALNP